MAIPKKSEIFLLVLIILSVLCHIPFAKEEVGCKIKE